MAYEHNPGKGSVFKNTDREKPHAYGGSIKLPDGTDCWINLYAATDRETNELRKDKDGNPFYNVGLKVKPEQGGGGYREAEPSRNDDRPQNDDMDDAIPFVRWEG